MSNFIETFKQGQAGLNRGLSTGIIALDKAINGIQKKQSLGIVAAPKVGKTTLADFCTLISPYLETEAKENERIKGLSSEDKTRFGQLWEEYKDKVKLELDPDAKRKMRLKVEQNTGSYWQHIEWIYFSFEIDRVNKEFKVASFFMAHDYGVYSFTYKGTNYQMNQDYLMGRQLHTNPDGTLEIIQMTKEHEEMLKNIYYNRIVPIFGEYSADGTLITPGKVIFVEDPENPTGLNKFLLHYADQHGRFTKEKYKIKEDGKEVVKERIVGYKEKNPRKFTIIITDHLRKLRRERGFSIKETMDKYLEYSTALRNICNFTFVHVAHSNRQLANVERLKFAGEYIFPTGDDVKDSGNVSEECTIVITMFNPNDEKYNLDRHFGVDLSNNAYPNYRSIHIAEARYVPCPQHIQTNMLGGINMFTPLGGFSQ